MDAKGVRRLASGDLVEGESFDTWRKRLGDALGQSVEGAYLRDVFSNGVVIFEVYGDKGPAKIFKTSYLVGQDGQFTFTPAVEVKQAWVEAEDQAALDAARAPAEHAERQARDDAASRGPRAHASSVRALLPLHLEGEQMPAQIPIHVLGEWDHPTYGHFKFTPEMREQAIANFKACTYRPNAPINAQVVVDERHEGGEANGWLTGMFARGDLLMASVEWNERGRQLVGDKRYRFISPCYLEDYDGKGTLFKEVTLTNRNFLKELPAIGEPVLLSEDAADVKALFLTPVRTDADGPPDGRNTGRQGAMSRASKDKGERYMEDKGKNPAGAEQTQGAPIPGQVSLTEAELKELQASAARVAEMEKRLVSAQARLDKAEGEAKNREIEAAVKDAGLRGVDAFTLNYVKGLLLQLPRDGAEDYQLEVTGGSPQKVNLFTSLKHFLANVPPSVPQGERTVSLDTPPGDREEVDKESAKELGKALSEAAPGDGED